VEPKTNEQIGANHIISKTGGNGFTYKQLKHLTKDPKTEKIRIRNIKRSRKMDRQRRKEKTLKLYG